jgi:signal-transduction protein with cAMP-binding, CBS, and nucleotidyltransferase domain
MHRRVSDLLRRGGVVIYTTPDTTVFEAVQKLSHHNVGSILVLSSSRSLAGIFTERDLLQRVVAKGLDPKSTKIGDVMTKDVIVVTTETSRHEVLQIMDQQHIRHVPVSDGTQLLGVISLRDVLRFDNAEKDFEIEQLKQYFLQELSAGEQRLSA